MSSDPGTPPPSQASPPNKTAPQRGWLVRYPIGTGAWGANYYGPEWALHEALAAAGLPGSTGDRVRGGQSRNLRPANVSNKEPAAPPSLRRPWSWYEWAGEPPATFAEAESRVGPGRVRLVGVAESPAGARESFEVLKRAFVTKTRSVVDLFTEEDLNTRDTLLGVSYMVTGRTGETHRMYRVFDSSAVTPVQALAECGFGGVSPPGISSHTKACRGSGTPVTPRPGATWVVIRFSVGSPSVTYDDVEKLFDFNVRPPLYVFKNESDWEVFAAAYAQRLPGSAEGKLPEPPPVNETYMLTTGSHPEEGSLYRLDASSPAELLKTIADWAENGVPPEHPHKLSGGPVGEPHTWRIRTRERIYRLVRFAPTATTGHLERLLFLHAYYRKGLNAQVELGRAGLLKVAVNGEVLAEYGFTDKPYREQLLTAVGLLNDGLPPGTFCGSWGMFEAALVEKAAADHAAWPKKPSPGSRSLEPEEPGKWTVAVPVISGKSGPCGFRWFGVRAPTPEVALEKATDLAIGAGFIFTNWGAPGSRPWVLYSGPEVVDVAAAIPYAVVDSPTVAPFAGLNAADKFAALIKAGLRDLELQGVPYEHPAAVPVAAAPQEAPPGGASLRYEPTAILKLKAEPAPTYVAHVGDKHVLLADLLPPTLEKAFGPCEDRAGKSPSSPGPVVAWVWPYPPGMDLGAPPSRSRCAVLSTRAEEWDKPERLLTHILRDIHGHMWPYSMTMGPAPDEHVIITYAPPPGCLVAGRPLTHRYRVPGVRNMTSNEVTLALIGTLKARFRGGYLLTPWETAPVPDIGAVTTLMSNDPPSTPLPSPPSTKKPERFNLRAEAPAALVRGAADEAVEMLQAGLLRAIRNIPNAPARALSRQFVSSRYGSASIALLGGLAAPYLRDWLPAGTAQEFATAVGHSLRVQAMATAGRTALRDIVGPVAELLITKAASLPDGWRAPDPEPLSLMGAGPSAPTPATNVREEAHNE